MQVNFLKRSSSEWKWKIHRGGSTAAWSVWRVKIAVVLGTLLQMNGKSGSVLSSVYTVSLLIMISDIPLCRSESTWTSNVPPECIRSKLQVVHLFTLLIHPKCPHDSYLSFQTIWVRLENCCTWTGWISETECECSWNRTKSVVTRQQPGLCFFAVCSTLP